VDRDAGLRGESLANRPTTLADYLAILGRRRWIIILPLLLAPAMAVLLSSSQQPLYEASAEIYLKRADIAAAGAGGVGTDPTLQSDPERFLQTQASVARDPKLAERVVAKAGVRGMTSGGLLGSSGVTPRHDADLLDVSVTSPSQSDAVRLANTYAEEFTRYRTELDTARIDVALENVRTRIRELAERGVSIDSAAYASLLEKQTDLETGKALANNTQVLRPAEGAAKIRPQTRRNGILGLLLGGILGIGLAFVAEALDRRVRSEREVEEALGIPLLGRIPKPPRRLRKADELVMLAQPRSIAAEPVRKLRTNIEFSNLERDARTILVTSSVQREGKSTTIANLGVALARADRRVALVDLDLRRPYLNRFFRVPPAPGITDVVLGRVDLDDALRPVPIPEGYAGSSRSTRVAVPVAPGSGNGRRRIEGILNVLPAGTMPPDAGEFVGAERLGKIIDSLAERFDFVLIDAPPLLAVGDAMTLSAKVDAILVLVRLKLAHRGMLHEVGRLLEACPADKLGYVLASAELGEGYGYGYAYAYEAREPEPAREQRVP
jgi:succinoglycan biosynthesis transport protein ExoP